jgi:hypothetical protein
MHGQIFAVLRLSDSDIIVLKQLRRLKLERFI